MARVPYVDKEDLPEDLRHLALSTSNITRALSNSPHVAFQSGTVAAYIKKTCLDPRLRELALVQVGYAARNAYEYAHHLKVAMDCGVSDDDLLAIADETAGRQTHLEPLARLVLRAAREMTDGLAVSAETFEALKKAFNNEELVELIFAIANYNGVVRMLASLGVEVEDDYQGLLTQFPLQA